MSIRAKTRKRVVILLLVGFILTAGLVGAFFTKKYLRTQDILAKRAAGMAAYDSNNYAEAIFQWDHILYIDNNQFKDIEMNLKYALSHLQVELPENKHLALAYESLGRILSVQPNHPEALKQWLELMTDPETRNIYIARVSTNKIINNADRYATIDPDSLLPLKAKALANYLALKDYKPALEYFDQIIEKEPDEFFWLLHRDRIMALTKKTPEERIDYALQLVAKHPDSLVHKLFLSMVYANVRKTEEARKMLDQAAESSTDDGKLILYMVNLYENGFRAYAEARDLLQKFVEKHDDPSVTAALAERQWQLREFDEANTTLQNVKPTPEEDVKLLALKAMTFKGLQKHDEAKPYIEQIESREGDNKAKCWTIFLKDIYTQGKRKITAVRESCEEALKYDPSNTYVNYYLAKAYEKSMDKRTLEQYRRVRAMAPTWPTALNEFASALKKQGHLQDASTISAQSMMIQRKNMSAVFNMLDVRWQQSKQGNMEATKVLNEILPKLYEKAPDTPSLLIMHVDTLMRLEKRSEADKVIETALKAEKPYKQESLLKLAVIAEEWDLPQADELFKTCQEHYGVSPTFANAFAQRLLGEGKYDEAKSMLSSYVDKFPQDRRFKIIYGVFLNRNNDPESGDFWKKMVEENKDNAAIVQQALKVTAFRDDFEYTQKLIGYLEKIEGPNSLTVKMARAQLLLRSGDSKTPDYSEALKLLEQITAAAPTDPQAWYYQARAFQGLGNTASAVMSMERAHGIRPESDEIAIALIGLYIAKDDRTKALELSDQVAKSDSLTPAQKPQLAGMYHRLGQQDKASQILESSKVPTLMQAVLYREQGRIADAVGVYRELLKRPSIQVIQNYADFLGSVGRVPDGQEVLLNLKKVKNLPEGYYELTLAEYLRKYNPPQALQVYEEVVSLVPDSSKAWRLFTLYHLRLGEIDKAIEVARRAKAALPGDKIFNILIQQEALIKSTGRLKLTHQIIQSLVEQSRYDNLVIQTLQLVESSLTRKQTPLDVSIELRSLADKNPRFMPLQLLTASWLMQVGKFEDASALAARSMDIFPNSTEPPKLAFSIASRKKEYDEALALAKIWRERARENPIEPDVAIANTYLKIGQPEEALKQIDPYITQVAKNPGLAPIISMVYFQALIKTDEAEKAQNLLKPLISKATLWRNFWIESAWRYIDTEKESIAWLERVEPVIPAKDTRSRLAFATAWRELGRKYDKVEYTNRSRNILIEMAKDIDAPVPVVVTLAMMEYETGRVKQADGLYRRVLASDKDNVFALNNLAVLLAEQPSGDNDEALKFAKQAVATNPNNANYQDTLSIVYMARKEYDKAIEALEKAVAFEPDKLEWQINLALAHHKNNQSDEALRIIRRIQLNTILIDELSDKMKKRYNDLKAELDARASVTGN